MDKSLKNGLQIYSAKENYCNPLHQRLVPNQDKYLA